MFEADARLYTLSSSERDKYKRHHPHVAPDVRDGLCKQSTLSDIYSFGRILSTINAKLEVHCLEELVKTCLQYKSSERPSTDYICNLLEKLS